MADDSAIGVWTMSDDRNQLLGADRDSVTQEPDAARPGLKAWVTPKVITSTISQDTALALGGGADGSAATTHAAC